MCVCVHRSTTHSSIQEICVYSWSQMELSLSRNRRAINWMIQKLFFFFLKKIKIYLKNRNVQHIFHSLFNSLMCLTVAVCRLLNNKRRRIKTLFHMYVFALYMLMWMCVYTTRSYPSSEPTKQPTSHKVFLFLISIILKTILYCISISLSHAVYVLWLVSRLFWLHILSWKQKIGE